MYGLTEMVSTCVGMFSQLYMSTAKAHTACDFKYFKWRFSLPKQRECGLLLPIIMPLVPTKRKEQYTKRGIRIEIDTTHGQRNDEKSE